MKTRIIKAKTVKAILAAFIILISAVWSSAICADGLSAEVIVSNSVISVNGNKTALSGYKIGGSNYCKIRDIASVMNGTTGEFNVSYDMQNGTAIWLGCPYLGAVGELKCPNAPQYAIPYDVQVNFNGEQFMSFSTFLINGEYYYMLKDIATCLNYELVTEDSINVDIRTDESVCSNTPLPKAEITYDVFSKTNLSAAQFENMLAGTGLAGLGPSFYAIERDSGVNGLFALAVAYEESGAGTSGLAREDNNFYGLTALGGGWRTFPSRAEGIQYFSTYITSSLYAGKTITEIAQTYCPGNDVWPGKIQRIMLEKYALVDPSVLEADEF